MFPVQIEEHLLDLDPTRMCELLVGPPEVNVIGVGELPLYLRIAITTWGELPVCAGCVGSVQRHVVDDGEVADLPCFDRRTRLVWIKQRCRCPNVAARW